MTQKKLREGLARAQKVRAIYAAARAAAGRKELSWQEEDEARKQVEALDASIPWSRLRHLQWVDVLAAR